MKRRSGAKIQPLKKPLRKRANISSLLRFWVSEGERRMERLSETTAWNFGFTRPREEEVRREGERVLDWIIFLVRRAERGWLRSHAARSKAAVGGTERERRRRVGGIFVVGRLDIIDFGK
jgi:hypothetical protein